VVETQGDSVQFVWAAGFGAAGDLKVRRDGGRFCWRRWARAGGRPPLDVATVETDFFAVPEGAPIPVFRAAGEETTLLWDRADVRVATADAKTLSLLPLTDRGGSYATLRTTTAVWWRRCTTDASSQYRNPRRAVWRGPGWEGTNLG
jgi:hypothetical protein